MYTSVSIHGFRCFGGLTVEPLARVNLIAGQNNVGKTALLEALWMLSHPTAPREALRVSQWRDSVDYGQGRLFADLFHRYEPGLAVGLESKGSGSRGYRSLNITHQYRSEQPIIDWSRVPETELEEEAISDFDLDNELVFEYTDDTGVKSSTKAWLDVDPASARLRPVLRDSRKMGAKADYPCVFQHSHSRYNARRLASLFGAAQLEGYVSSVEKIIRLLEPELERMETITDSRGIPALYGHIGSGLPRPMSVTGDGTKRLLALALSFLRLRNGIMLIDEVENGLHYSALVDVWKNLEWLSREFNVQVFATTHSYECIVAASDAFTEIESDNLHLHRLYRKDNKVKSVSYRKKPLDTNIEYSWELR